VCAEISPLARGALIHHGVCRAARFSAASDLAERPEGFVDVAASRDETAGTALDVRDRGFVYELKHDGFRGVIECS
jgi:hypothetical protein